MTAKDLNHRYSDKDKWPTFLEAESTATEENTYKINCDIPASLSYFKGHFPDQPVLPGVVQANWANDIAKQIFDCAEFRGVNSLKFNTMILPNSEVTLSLTLNPEKHTVKFSYNSEDTLFSSGTLVFSTA